jgi:hypothetical protein
MQQWGDETFLARQQSLPIQRDYTVASKKNRGVPDRHGGKTVKRIGAARQEVNPRRRPVGLQKRKVSLVVRQ